MLHSQLGTAYLVSRSREQAATEFKAELEITARDFNSNFSLGRIYREDGRLDEASVLLKKALELRPDDAATLYEMAQLAQSKGSDEEAIALLERAIKQDHYLTAAHVLLARLYYKVNRILDAEREGAEIQRLNAEEQRLYQERQKQQPPPNNQGASSTTPAPTAGSLENAAKKP